LFEFLELLKEDPSFQMKNPGVTTSVNGKNKTLYMPKVTSIEEATRFDIINNQKNSKLKRRSRHPI
jgi:hypothetical protein